MENAAEVDYLGPTSLWNGKMKHSHTSRKFSTLGLEKFDVQLFSEPPVLMQVMVSEGSCSYITGHSQLMHMRIIYYFLGDLHNHNESERESEKRIRNT